MLYKAKRRLAEVQDLWRCSGRKVRKTAVFFQYEVFYRTSDRQDVHSVFGSDLYCHKTASAIILSGM